MLSCPLRVVLDSDAADAELREIEVLTSCDTLNDPCDAREGMPLTHTAAPSVQLWRALDHAQQQLPHGAKRLVVCIDASVNSLF